MSETQRPPAFLPDAEDFDQYCATAGIPPDEEPQAFAAWLTRVSGWDACSDAVADDA
jgi:hypothetical protein